MKRRLRDVLCSPLWADSSDEEIARCFGHPIATVRAERDKLRADIATAEIATRLRQLSHALSWPGTLTELQIHILDAHIRMAERSGGKHPDPKMQELRDALVESRRLRVLEGGKRVG